ncbi:hypothetical protein [Flectobacillus roseus]|uniref:hypothetical protein n=1 Tax=Flectobacillus roseus TaxID=502259 RepID=UPI0024B78A0C|nr:hypothetical protein [Flectobacillus roseus]MDI9871571.1 hypothetical protein [Flectobacillus roseus]
MKKNITIYCEGKKGSHDFDILEKVVPEGTLIVPIGGKKGANAIIAFREAGTVKSDFCRMFRDRDFDCSVPDVEQLTFDGNKTLFSYRTTIENYLFDIEIFLNFINYRCLNHKYNINSANDVKLLFVESAKEIKYYQAVRHTLGKMRFANSFNTTWITNGSGTLPLELDFNSCSENGWKLVNDILTKSNHEWTHQIFKSELDYFIDKFDENFFENLDFLVHFQGKDFAKALTNKLESFPLKDYYNYFKSSFDFCLYKDLQELQNIINNQILKN